MRNRYPEYIPYFQALLCGNGKSLRDFDHLFDDRDPKAKRREFSAGLKRKARAQLERAVGSECQLRIAQNCDPRAATVLDHIIPLSSNVLNKRLKGARGSAGRNAPTESFGSNDLANLTLACRNCNAFKMNKILDAEVIRRLLRSAENGNVAD